MHSSNDAAQQPSLKHADLFSFPPTQRNGLLDSPTTKAKRSTDQSLNLRASFEKLQASLNKSFPNQARAYSPPINKEALTPHPFRPNATRAIEQDGLGGSPYLVSKIIPQREGPRCQRFVEARQRGPSCARTFWKLSTGTRPSRPVESEYPCCYSALPTELRLVMRILTSSVISRIPSLAGFLGSKQAGFSAM